MLHCSDSGISNAVEVIVAIRAAQYTDVSVYILITVPLSVENGQISAYRRTAVRPWRRRKGDGRGADVGFLGSCG